MLLALNGLDISARILLGLIVTYLVATVSEVLLHRYIAHASSKARRYWARHPRLFGHLLKLHYRHTIVHHGLTFRMNHVTQFKDTNERELTDRIVALRADELIHREDYGLTIGLRGLISYNMTVAPILPILYWIAGPWALCGALPVLTLAPFSAMLLHPFLHEHHETARKPSAMVQLLMRTKYYRMLWTHHFVHHKYPNSNFNLLLGGDFLLGTYRRPNPSDLAEMEEVGMPLVFSKSHTEQCNFRIYD